MEHIVIQGNDMLSFMLSKYHPLADDVSLYVQDAGGFFEIHRSMVEFYIPKEYFDFMILKYPFLRIVDYVW